MKRVVNKSENIATPVIIAALLVLVIAALLVSTGIVDIRNLKLGAITGSSGFTVNSITSPAIISNDQDLANANFLISVTVNGGGQSIVGTIGESDFQRWLPNLDVKYPLEISMGGISETLKYPIRNDGTQITRYTFTKVYRKDFWNGAQCLGSHASCIVVKDIAGYSGTGNDMVILVDEVPVGVYGSFGNPEYQWKGQMTVSINSIPITQTIGSAESAGSLDFKNSAGEQIVHASWAGNLLTGQAWPNQNNFIPTYSYTTPKWKVADKKYLTPYLSNREDVVAQLAVVQSKIDTCYKNIDTNDPYCAKPRDDLLSAINVYNANEDILESQDSVITDVSSTGGGEIVKSITGGLNDGTVIESTDRRIASPVLQLIVKADKLGVLIPVGKPEIVSIDVPSFSSGDNKGVAIVTVKNTGSGTGTFSATFPATSTFSPISNVESAKLTLAPGATGTIAVYIGHGATAISKTETATMKVYDYNKPSNYATKTFTITMTVPKACTPGTTRTDSKIVYTCNQDGYGETITLDCTGKALDYNSGKYSCTTTANTTGKGTNSGGVPSGELIEATRLNWYETNSAKVLAGLIILLGLLLIWRKQNE
ncbi:MAG: hypothetical protein PHW62_00655 [Candidatus Ratteibacteria bacterium]|nr:hypothetical protein [Candidatus Ratteibacteria bacterium]